MNELSEHLSKLLEESVSDAFPATISLVPKQIENEVILDDECIISSIGFIGSIEGSIAICLPNSSACQIVSRMIHSTLDDANREVIDGIAEQINMIAGGVKMKLMKETEHSFEISIPTTIKGNRMVILSDFSNTHRISFHYCFEDIVFSLSLIYKLREDKNELEQKKKNARSRAFDRLNKLMGEK